MVCFKTNFCYNRRMQKVLSLVRRAVEKYNLINEGDKIAIGVSGGKDSMLLAAALSELSKFYPKKFSVKAFTIDATGGKTDWQPLRDYFASKKIDYEVINSDIFDIVFNERKEKNPCSLCAKLRRGILCTTAASQGYNKLALGHHKDDLIETFFMSMFHEGRLSTFMPKTKLSKTNITQIRPLIFMEEREIASAVKRLKIPVVKNVCPVDKTTERAYYKELIASESKHIKNLKTNLFNAIISSERYNLFDKDFTD